VEEQDWEPARLIPVSGINGADEQERRGVSALMAVLVSVREFGRAITVPLGAPAGAISAFIEVPFTLEGASLRPDGLIRVVRGGRTWTALVEVKTGRNDLTAPQIEGYLDVAREQGFDAVLTISNQLVSAPGEHPVDVDRRKCRKVALHHLSWSEIHTEAVIERVNHAVADPDQAWILAELIRYLEHPRSGAVDFDDMGPSWVTVREAVTQRTLRATDKHAAEVVSRFGQLVAFSGMRLARSLGVPVKPVMTRAELADRGGWTQAQIHQLVEHGTLQGSLRVPNAVAPFTLSADPRAGRISCSITVDAPTDGRPTTRVNWLLRQLHDAPDSLLIEAVAARTRGAGPLYPIVKLREKPELLIEDPSRELKAFIVTLGAVAGTKRGQGRGSFVGSMLDLSERFYAEVVQHLRPWSATAPRSKSLDTAVHDAAAGEIVGELPIEDEVADHPDEETSVGSRDSAYENTGSQLGDVPVETGRQTSAVFEDVDADRAVVGTSPTSPGADGWDGPSAAMRAALEARSDQPPDEPGDAAQDPKDSSSTMWSDSESSSQSSKTESVSSTGDS